MEKNNETINGEFVDQETESVKKKFTITPKLKKALVIGGIVISTALLTAATMNKKTSETGSDREHEDNQVCWCGDDHTWLVEPTETVTKEVN